jgi:D-alanyl-lipoteichoic acid acyltransferase DltB (MBOAT superfamily)
MPYFARSLGDFWKRWHISLSTWFRDYLYIPLGGKLVSQRRLIMNLMITFLVSGFWHGANWTFIVWGGIHGSVLVLEKFFYSKKNSNLLKKALSLLVTQSIVVLAWIFFRAASISDAFHFIAGIFSFNFFPLSINYLFDSIDLLIWFGTIGLLFFTELSMGKERNIEQFMGSKSTLLRYTYYCLMPCLILWFGTFSETEFIYFQF